MKSQNAFSMVALLYSAANLGSMGLELNLRETIKSLRSVRVLALTIGWSWLVGPAFAVLLTKIFPMAEPYAVGLLIFSLAPTAPALPMLIRRARADLIIEDQLLVELKSVENLAAVHSKQVITCLRLLNLPLGLLINFGAATFKEGCRRIGNGPQSFVSSCLRVNQSL